MGVNMAEFVRKQAEQREDDEAENASALRSCGWKQSCDYPGSYWLWSKSFPESKIQWRLQRDGSREPRPPFTVNGVSLDMAVIMESAWQQLFDDTREFASDDDEDAENPHAE